MKKLFIYITLIIGLFLIGCNKKDVELDNEYYPDKSFSSNINNEDGFLLKYEHGVMFCRGIKPDNNTDSNWWSVTTYPNDTELEDMLLYKVNITGKDYTGGIAGVMDVEISTINSIEPITLQELYNNNLINKGNIDKGISYTPQLYVNPITNIYYIMFNSGNYYVGSDEGVVGVYETQQECRRLLEEDIVVNEEDIGVEFEPFYIDIFKIGETYIARIDDYDIDTDTHDIYFTPISVDKLNAKFTKLDLKDGEVVRPNGALLNKKADGTYILESVRYDILTRLSHELDIPLWEESKPKEWECRRLNNYFVWNIEGKYKVYFDTDLLGIYDTVEEVNELYNK